MLPNFETQLTNTIKSVCMRLNTDFLGTEALLTKKKSHRPKGLLKSQSV